MPPAHLPPVTVFPDPAVFAALGEEGFRRLVRAVYRNLGASPIAGMFPSSPEALDAAADKSALFFIGISGGPRLYEQTYGAPRMRQRHEPFRITEAARVEWLKCWEEVLRRAPEDFGFPPEHLGTFREYLTTFSKWMVNAP